MKKNEEDEIIAGNKIFTKENRFLYKLYFILTFFPPLFHVIVGGHRACKEDNWLSKHLYLVVEASLSEMSVINPH